MNNRHIISILLTTVLIFWTLLLLVPAIPLFVDIFLVVIGATISAHALLSLWQGTNLTTDIVDYEPE